MSSSYRQYVELALKDIYLGFSDDENKEAILRSSSHRLVQMWRRVEPMVSDGATGDDLEVVRAAGDYIAELDRMDPRSVTFRYPIERDLTPTIPEEWRIDLTNLKARMTELQTFFDGCTGWLDHLRHDAQP